MGGVIWLISRRFGSFRWLAFVAIYAGMILVNHKVAPYFGREALPCYGDPLKSRSVIFCALNRNYVDPKIKAMLVDYANDMEAEFPATLTNTLDGSFPFFNMSLLPHISHKNGKQVDLAFYYEYNGYPKDDTPSPIGYFAFEYPEGYPYSEMCPEAFPTLRWDLLWLQKFWKNETLDEDRMRFMLNWFVDHQEEYGIHRILIEPHLRESLNVNDEVIGFQGCRAARHDDHLHIQLY